MSRPEPGLKVALLLDSSLDLSDGVQQYVLSVGSWLADQGHEVHYVVGDTRQRDLPHIHSLAKSITVAFNGNKINIPLWANKKTIRQLLDQEQFDIIHVQTPHHPFMAQRVICGASAKTGVVATFHILPYSRLVKASNRLLGYLLRPSLRRIDRLLAVSPKAAEFATWSFGMPADVSPNMFDYERFHNAQPFERYQDDTLTILFFGRLVERKGCIYLLQALATLDRSPLPKLRVVVCGKGEQMDELQQYVRQNNMSDIVEFTGFVSEEDKPRYYASADISVFPSTGGESFGIVLLEAMASGKAGVLAGNNPGYASVMQPKPEQLFNPKDTTALTDLLVRYITDSSLRQTAALWGAEHARQFDASVVGPELVTVYKNAIAKRRAALDNI